MVIIDHEVSIKRPPRLVWRALIDFDRYKSWNPFSRFRGEARLGVEVEYQYFNKFAGRSFSRAPAKITRLEEEVAFEWRTGVPVLFDIREGYELSPSSGGTLLRHYIVFRGPMSWIMFKKARQATYRKLRDRSRKGSTVRLARKA